MTPRYRVEISRGRRIAIAFESRDYRVIYAIGDGVLLVLVLEVLNRREAYR